MLAVAQRTVTWFNTPDPNPGIGMLLMNLSR